MCILGRLIFASYLNVNMFQLPMQIFVYLHLACDVIGDLEVNKVGFRSTNLAELSNVM